MRNGIKKMAVLLLCFSLFTFCGKDGVGNNCSNNFGTQFQSDLNAISAASTAYGNDQSQANCNALKAAYQNYVDNLRDWEECARVGGFTQAWQDALDDAEASIAGIC
jgi:hypothetical protein